MPPFASKPVNPSSFTASLRRQPFLLFGLPFLGTVVLASFALSHFTQTRYDYRDHKVQAVSKEEELGMRKDRRRIDVREEYYRMRATGDIGESDDYENVRVGRLPGQAEWGELPVAKKE
ncbi:Cytochrome oxidase assembly [Rhodotorula kratochvilovae]